MTNKQPVPLLALGLPLPTSAGLPVRLLCDGATAGDPSVLALTTGVGLDDGLELGGGVVATGGGGGGGGAAGGGGAGAGTDETCETCETCPPPEPDT